MKILILMCSLLIAGNLYAQTFDSYFNEGNYEQAIKILEKDPTIKNQSYHLGICYSRLQEFDKAIPLLAKSIKEKNITPDIYYEYGQALYAANELKQARLAFQNSVKNDFNPAASLYYIGHISQVLEEYKIARNSFTTLIKNYPNEKKLKQIAQFQLAESTLVTLKEKTAPQVNKFILPLLKEAEATDPTSTVAQEIDKRYHELLVEYKLDPDLLDNGRRVSSRRWDATFTQRVKFDDNVTNTSLENVTTPTTKESFYFETEGYYKYTFLFNKKFIVAPEVRVTFTQYDNQADSDIFQNDAYIINISDKNKYEHTAFNHPASLLFDIDYSKTAKDYNKVHKRDTYSKSINLTLGESLSFFNFGDSNFKIKRKDYIGTDTAINNHTYDLSIDQTIALASQNLIIIMADASVIDNYNNTSTSTNTLLTRCDFIMPEIFTHHTLGLALATTFTDTKDQQSTRGTETTINPSIDLSRDITKEMKMSLNYDFTNNNSKSSTYKYQKSVVTMEFKYVF